MNPRSVIAYKKTESNPFWSSEFEKYIEQSLFTGHYMKMGANVSYQFYPSNFSHNKSIPDCKRAVSPTRMIQAWKYP